jgi:DNA-binding response OmpR family regulator
MTDLGAMSCCNRYSVLCVEDEEEFLGYLVSILKQYFSEVYSAKNVQQAYDIIDTKQVDIIVTDLYMPKINGIDFIKHLRSERKSVSVIFLTACSEKDFIHEAIPLCLDAYLIKPLSLDKLFETLIRSIGLIEGRSAKTYALKGGVSFDLFDEIAFETDTRKQIELTKKEILLLSILVKNNNRILSKSVIEEYIWDFQSIGESSVKTLVKKLRGKIGCEAIVTHGTTGYSIAYEKVLTN